MLDHFAEWSWMVGDYYRPTSERVWAGAKGIGTAAFLTFGGRVAGWAGGKLLGSGLRVASIGGDIEAGQTVRLIQKGERVKDLVQELAERTYLTDGSEHAIISLNNGERLMVSGGRGGIDLAAYDVNRVIIHTHPTPTGPSPIDFNMLRQTGQASSYIYELFGGGLTKFYGR